MKDIVKWLKKRNFTPHANFLFFSLKGGVMLGYDKEIMK